MELDSVQSNYQTSIRPSSDVQSQATITTQTHTADIETAKTADKTTPSQVGGTSATLELNNDIGIGNVLDDKNRTNEKNVKGQITEINKMIKASHQEVQMSQHAVTKAIMVKLVNTETKEVVREFPPEKLQDMIAKLWETAGLIVDEKR